MYISRVEDRLLQGQLIHGIGKLNATSNSTYDLHVIAHFMLQSMIYVCRRIIYRESAT